MTFDAPWAGSVKLISAVVSLLMLGVALVLPPLAQSAPLALLAASALFTVRGYRLTPDRLLVERLFWATEVDLSGLRAARHDPESIRRSLRLFGNGGLYSISGYFRNKKLGTYRAWATDPKNAVVLTFDDRTLVVTPGEPTAFVRQLALQHPGLAPL